MIRVVCLVLSLAVASTAHADDDFFLTLGTSKSVRLAGLLDYILPIFKSASNVRVQVIPLEAGRQIESGEKGKANALLLDDPAAVDKVMTEKFGVLRNEAFADDAVIVGPKSDPAGIRGLKDAGRRSRKLPPRARRLSAAATAAILTSWSCGSGNPPAPSLTSRRNGIVRRSRTCWRR